MFSNNHLNSKDSKSDNAKELAMTILLNNTICSRKIIGSALDHMSNDKQSRNNLIRIAARRWVDAESHNVPTDIR